MRAHIILATAIILISNSCGTTNSARSGLGKLPDSILTDRDGNHYPTKVLMDGNLWMTANLNLNIPNSHCYEDKNENCARYGRLYDWPAATQGCSMFEEGWRLPTNNEWQQLIRLYGGSTGDSTMKREGAYKALLYSGASGFDAVLGGNRDGSGNFARKDAHGFYWTATESGENVIWYYNFGKNSLALFQQDGGDKVRGFSVRCVNSKRRQK